jgi:hypothetical protein
MQPAGPDAILERLEKHVLQVAAMEGELRPLVAREAPQGFAMDELAVSIEENGFSRDYAGLREGILQAQ